jgi:hypothetical protein
MARTRAGPIAEQERILNLLGGYGDTLRPQSPLYPYARFLEKPDALLPKNRKLIAGPRNNSTGAQTVRPGDA